MSAVDDDTPALRCRAARSPAALRGPLVDRLDAAPVAMRPRAPGPQPPAPRSRSTGSRSRSNGCPRGRAADSWRPRVRSPAVAAPAGVRDRRPCSPGWLLPGRRRWVARGQAGRPLPRLYRRRAARASRPQRPRERGAHAVGDAVHRHRRVDRPRRPDGAARGLELGVAGAHRADPAEQRSAIMVCGIAAGIAAAYHAPVAGVVFCAGAGARASSRGTRWRRC